VIDAHQHFWKLSRGDYHWMDPSDAVLYRDRGPEDLAPLMKAAGVTRTVAVQAATTIAETHYLLEIADATPWVAGVVGWIDLTASDAANRLGDLAQHAKFRGVRPMIQDIEDPEWMLDPVLDPALRALCEAELCFDALVLPHHLKSLLVLLNRYPDLRVVIDHAAKPRIADGHFSEWSRAMRTIAQDTAAHCKLSGLVTEAGADWETDTLRPYCEDLLSSFGSARILWGSDWPVVDLAGGYARWRDASLQLLSALDASERSAILGTNAERFYGLASGETKATHPPSHEDSP
jgi:L-fuconolactonase